MAESPESSSPDVAPEVAPEVAAAATQLPSDTTPTWETELLISGALAFGSLQLPGMFDDWFLSWLPRLAENFGLPMTIGYVFLKSLATLVALTFGLHIILRGFWAAAIGLNSIYPEGVQWERIKSGPIFRAVAQRTVVSLPVFISRLDNASSLGFALGAMVLILTGLSAVGSILAIGISFVVARLSGQALSPMVGVGLAAAIFGLPGILGSLIDRRFGARLAEGSRWRRLLERIASYSTVAAGSRVTGPMLLVFTSRQGQLRGTIITTALIYGVFAVVFGQTMIMLGYGRFDGYDFLPTNGRDVATPVNYANQRLGHEQSSTSPFIASEIIQDGVLRVFVPYRISRYDTVIKAECPEAVAASKSTDSTVQSGTARAVIACFSSRLAPEIDSVPVVNGTWRIGTDPASEQRGFELFVSLRESKPGPHLFSLRRIPRPEAKKTSVVERIFIPFYYDPK
jgi:hypothetical protein